MFITDLISKITNFRVKIGDKLNTLKSQIGQLNLLTTNDKTSLVGAVNEVNSLLPTVEEFTNTLKKNESNTVTEDFEIVNDSSTFKIEPYTFVIRGELEDISNIRLCADDGIAVQYTMNNGDYFTSAVGGIQGQLGYYWSLLTPSTGDSRMLMPITGITGRVLTTGAKVGATTYYANNQGVIELPEDSEFVKNGEGWSLKYRVDNPNFYGTIGKNAIDLSVATAVNTEMPERFSFGANAWYTAVFGNNNSAMGTASLVSGGLNRSQGQCNNIISYSSTIIEDKGTENYSKKDNGIYSGTHNTITNTRNSVILGGTLNKITGNENPKSGNYSTSNAIIGGWNNEIFSSPNTNRPVYSSFILGGELNKAQGYYNIVGGYSNHAVTIGETLFGTYGTIQNTSLNGFDFINNSRMFNVGIGKVLNGNEVRIDGFSVFRHGLVTAPSLTTSLIENNNKAVTTKEFVDSKISNFKLPTNWESPEQRFSGLVDKSADATFNKIAVFDSQNNLGTAKLYTSEFIRIKNGSNIGFALKHRSENPNFYGLIGNQAIDLSLSYSTSSNNGANGYQSVAIGNDIRSTGDQSVGIGTMAITSSSSVSIGNIVTSGNSSVAIGKSSNASGSQATAIGNQAKATGFFSMAVGSSTAIGQRATAIGTGNKANVDYSNVLGGSFLNANVYKSVVLGFSNPIKTNQSTTTWVPTDDLFVVGNGNNLVNELSEALNLKKNGHLTLPSVTNDMIDTNPKSVVTKEYLDDKTTNIILTSPNGTKFKLTVDDDGTLIATKVV